MPDTLLSTLHASDHSHRARADLTEILEHARSALAFPAALLTSGDGVVALVVGDALLAVGETLPEEIAPTAWSADLRSSDGRVWLWDPTPRHRRPGPVEQALLEATTARVDGVLQQARAPLSLPDAIFEHAGDALVVVDGDHKVLRVNKAFLQQFGYASNDIVGRTTDVLYAEPLAIRRQAPGVTEDEPYEARYRQAKGEVFIGETDTVVLWGPDRTPKAYIRRIRDVTQRKHSVSALQQAHTDSALLLRELHHRVKNNLQVISSLISLRLGQAGSGQARDILDDLHSRVRAIAIAHEILFSRRTVGTIELSAMLQRLVDETAHACPNPNITFTTELVEVEIPDRTASPIALVVNELTTNAIKHAFAEGRTGTVSVETRKQDGALLIEVIDNGVGFAWDERGDASLGLELVEAMAEQLSATLQSSAESGTRVCLRIPL